MEPKLAVIAEDNDAVRAVLEVEVGRYGYAVVAAADGLQALASAGTLTQLDLLVTDQQMPCMDGLQLASTLRRVFPGVPVLLISGDRTALAEAERILGGRTRSLMKPFGAAQFHAAMREMQVVAEACHTGDPPDH